jgi:anaerobic selenocysteine-containing dehydrogenase
VRTAAGVFRARAKLTSGLHPGTVAAQHGWWQDCPALDAKGYPAAGEGSANVNLAIAADAEDPLSGSLPLRSTPCRVERLD